MDIQAKKIELIQWLSTVDDTAVINKVIALMKHENSDWWNSIDKKEKAAIEKGLQDAEKGKLNPNSKARDLYAKWL